MAAKNDSGRESASRESASRESAGRESAGRESAGKGNTDNTAKKGTLTEQELKIMKVIWGREQATVRQVYEALREHRPIAYTTVMTMMNILTKKGHLQKRAEGRAFLYQPTRPRQQVISNLVNEFLDRVFNGSARPLLLSLIKDRKVSEQDLAEITRLIEEEETKNEDNHREEEAS